MRPTEFTIDGEAEAYQYEQDAKWARTIEIPIFKRILDQEFAKTDNKLRIILEVGNVMSHHTGYGPGDHYDVLDLYEHAPDVLNYDATFWQPGAANYSLIISISTLEHIGQARYGGQDQAYQPMAAAYNLFTWSLAPGGRMIFSIPLKYRGGADLLVWDAFPDTWTRKWFFRNIGHGEWRQNNEQQIRTIKHYGKPWPGANALAIVQVQKPS